MQALKPALRRQLLGRGNLYSRPLYGLQQTTRRWQHNQYGPHKEYFQTPGQAPVPDTTPYQPGEQIYITPTNNEPAPLSRFLRSVGWAALFCVLGLGAGAGMNTYSYLLPPNEPGSEEEQEILEEIEDMMTNNPVAQDLRDQGFLEEEFYTRGFSAGHNLVRDTLRGSSQGLSVKVFRHPTTNYTFVLFFVGFGLDGFPDVMHGGITATMILEAATKHAHSFFPDLTIKDDEPAISIDYKKPVRPGEIYTIMMPPATVEPVRNHPGLVILKTQAHLLRIDNAPKIQIRQNLQNGMAEHTIEVQTTVGIDPNMAQGVVAFEVESNMPSATSTSTSTGPTLEGALPGPK
jgi:hypothetical protein